MVFYRLVHPVCGVIENTTFENGVLMFAFRGKKDKWCYRKISGVWRVRVGEDGVLI